MKWLKDNWGILLLILFVFLWAKFSDKEPVQKPPVEIRVEVPVIEKQYDTIYKPSPVIEKKVIDKEYYNRYLTLKDSIEKNNAYKEAVTIREYKQDFEDSVQTINVYSKVRGDMLAQTLSYKTKPRELTVPVDIPSDKKRTFSAGMEVGVPTVQVYSFKPVIKAGLVYKNKRDNTFSVSYDTEGRVWVGKTFKLF